MLGLWLLDVDVDETVSRSIQVGAEREQVSLIGDVRILGLEVVHKFDPWQQAYERKSKHKKGSNPSALLISFHPFHSCETLFETARK